MMEDIRARTRAPVHVERVARGGRAVAAGVEVLRGVHRARVGLASRHLEEHLVEADVAPAARVGAAAGRVPTRGGAVGVAGALVVRARIGVTVEAGGGHRETPEKGASRGLLELGREGWWRDAGRWAWGT